MDTDGYLEGTLGLVIDEQQRAQGAFGYTKEEWENLTVNQAEPTLFCEHEDGSVDPKTGRKRDCLPVGTIKKTWVDEQGQMHVRADFYTSQLGQQMRQNVLNGNFNQLSIGFDAYNLGTKEKPYYKSNFKHVGICRVGAEPSAIIQVRASMSSGEGAKQQLEQPAGGDAPTPMDAAPSKEATPSPSPPTSEDMFAKFKDMSREDLAKLAAEREAQKELMEELKAEKMARDQKRSEKLKQREIEAREKATEEAKQLAAQLGWSEELTMQNAPLFASKDENAQRIAQNFRDNAKEIQKLKEEAAQARKEAEDIAVMNRARQGYDDAKKRSRGNNYGNEAKNNTNKMAEEISSLFGGQVPKGDMWSKIFEGATRNQPSSSSSSSAAAAAAPSSSSSAAAAAKAPEENKNGLPSWLNYMVSTPDHATNEKDNALRREWSQAVEVRQSGGSYLPFVEIRQTNFKTDDGKSMDYLNRSSEVVSLFFSNPDGVEKLAYEMDPWNTWTKKSVYDGVIPR